MSCSGTLSLPSPLSQSPILLAIANSNPCGTQFLSLQQISSSHASLCFCSCLNSFPVTDEKGGNRSFALRFLNWISRSNPSIENNYTVHRRHSTMNRFDCPIFMLSLSMHLPKCFERANLSLNSHSHTFNFNLSQIEDECIKDQLIEVMIGLSGLIELSLSPSFSSFVYCLLSLAIIKSFATLFIIPDVYFPLLFLM